MQELEIKIISEEICKNEIPDTTPEVSKRLREQFLNSAAFKSAEIKLDEVPVEIVACPYRNPFWRSGNQADEAICCYHFATRKKPTRIDCYLCKK